MLAKHLDWGRGTLDLLQHPSILTTEVPDNKVTPAGKVGDPHNLEYHPVWSDYFPPDAELVEVRGYYRDPWFRNWPNVGPSSAPYTMMAVKATNGQAKEQTTVPEEMKLLPNAKQNLYWWTVEELREECIRQGLIDPTKRLHKKALIDLLEPGLGLKPPYARKIGQVWDPEKHIWIDA